MQKWQHGLAGEMTQASRQELLEVSSSEQHQRLGHGPTGSEWLSNRHPCEAMLHKGLHPGMT